MKRTIKTITALTAVVAGSLIAEAHPHQKNQQAARDETRPYCEQNICRQQPCMQCSPRYGKQGPQQRFGPRHQQQGPQQFGPGHQQQGRQQFGQRPRQQGQARFQQPAARQGRQNQQFRNPCCTPERENNRPRIRQRLMERFDRNGDGQLSESERQAARNAWEKRQQVHPDSDPRQQDPAAVEE